jgi:hypothetical protein
MTLFIALSLLWANGMLDAPWIAGTIVLWIAHLFVHYEQL